MASFELTQVKRENHPFHSNILPFLPLYFHTARVAPRQPSKQTASTRRTVGNRCFRVPGIWLMFVFAGLAQLVEQLICNQSVIGSSPISSSIGLWKIKMQCTVQYRINLIVTLFMNKVLCCTHFISFFHAIPDAIRWMYRNHMIRCYTQHLADSL